MRKNMNRLLHRSLHRNPFASGLTLSLAFMLATGSLSAQELWSNPTTWGGSVPSVGQNVLIPTGKVVELDVDTASLGNLEVQGTLRFQRKNLNLTASHVVVHHGLLEIGTEAVPFAEKATITLTGTDKTAAYMIHTDSTGTKGLVAIHGGQIEIHGARRSALAWTKLNATANAGATSITLATAPNWRVGDKIVIAPSGFNPLEAESVTITAVSGTTVTFTPALAYKHWGALQTIEGKTVDHRAEVGLLTRDVVIQGAADSDAINFGGHGMVHHDGWVRIEGAEFYRMGQLGKQGRYALHWHFAGDGTGQYIKNSSIWNSFHRAVATHQTDNVLVESNVAYNVQSHMYIPAEDGVEIGNVYRNNLGILSHKINAADFAFPLTSNPGQSFQSEERPGLFWLQHPNNKIEGNAVAGQTFGHGYFYDIGRGRHVTGANADFTNNTSHAIKGPLEADYNYSPNQRGSGLFVDDYKPKPSAIPQVFSGLNTYKCMVGAWTEQNEQALVNSTITDNGIGVITHRGSVEDSVVIGATANTIGGVAPLVGPEKKTGGVHVVRGQGGIKTPNIRNVTFIDQRDGGLVWLDNLISHGSSVEQMTLIRTVPIYMKNMYSSGSTFSDPTAFLMDKDGSGSGLSGPQRLVLKNHPLINGTSVLVSAMNGYRNPMVDSTEVIVDNPAAVLTGTWTTATSPSGFQGSDFVHDGNTGKGSKTATFNATLPSRDWYRVSARWTAASSHASNTPLTIAGGAGEETPAGYVINQRVSGGTWVPLDSFSFGPGTAAGEVKISNAGTNGTVVADAVKFTRLIAQ